MARYKPNNQTVSQEGIFDAIGKWYSDKLRNSTINAMFSERDKLPAVNGVPVKTYMELKDRLKHIIESGEQWDVCFYYGNTATDVYSKSYTKKDELVEEDDLLKSAGAGFLFGTGRDFKYRYYQHETNQITSFIAILHKDFNLKLVYD